MNINNLNNLIELFVNQANKQNKKDIFLEWLNPSNKKSYTWEQTEKNILKLSKVIKENIEEGDRCLLVSENRPEWFVSDLAIMVAGGITVPAYTTYTEDDYKYLIEDCEPSLVVVSNNEMLKKLNNSINEKDFIKKVITLDENLAGKNPIPLAKGAYPIASLTWILAYEKGNGRNTKAIKQVFNTLLSDEYQDKASSLGFIPLKGDILDKSRAAVEKIGS